MGNRRASCRPSRPRHPRARSDRDRNLSARQRQGRRLFVARATIALVREIAVGAERLRLIPALAPKTPTSANLRCAIAYRGDLEIPGLAFGPFRNDGAKLVMAGLVPAIHVLLHRQKRKTWMPGIADKFTQSAQSRLLWPGMPKKHQYAPVLLASLLVCTRPRLFSILPSSAAKSFRSCAERQDRISCSLRSRRGISSWYSALPFRVMRSWYSRRSSSFSTRSTSCRLISAVTARLMVGLWVRVQCATYFALHASLRKPSVASTRHSGISSP